MTNYDFGNDPYVIDLICRSSNYHSVEKKIQEAYLKRNTYCYRELASLRTKYEQTAEELGFSVADWWLMQSIAQYQKQVSVLVVLEQAAILDFFWDGLI